MFGQRKDTPLQEVFAQAGCKGGKAKKVLLVLVDGFGYRQWLRYVRDNASLRRLTNKGVVVPLTAVFPSTTAAALTTIHSGLTPQEHGLLEWRMYLEEVGEAVLTLPFSPVGGKGMDSLLDAGVNPRILFDRHTTLYTQLSSGGVPSYIFLRHAYSRSAYSSVAHRGATIVPFVNASDLFVNVRKNLETARRTYIHVYWDAFDAIAHKYGHDAEHSLAELNNFFYSFQKELLGKLDGRAASETILLVTADHGHVSVNPHETIYLNRYRTVARFLKTDRKGHKIFPWGSPRDVFLAIKSERVGMVTKYLSQQLSGKATVMRTEQALKDGLFGRGATHKKLKNRMGNILVIPHGNATVWYAPDATVSEKHGMHGGLHADEMLVPFAVIKLSSLSVK